MGAYEGRHALIFAAAPETDYSYIRAFLGEHSDALIACADVGLRHARALGLHPDFMISDCDSMPETEGGRMAILQPCVRSSPFLLLSRWMRTWFGEEISTVN